MQTIHSAKVDSSPENSGEPVFEFDEAGEADRILEVYEEINIALRTVIAACD